MVGRANMMHVREMVTVTVTVDRQAAFLFSVDFYSSREQSSVSPD